MKTYRTCLLLILVATTAHAQNNQERSDVSVALDDRLVRSERYGMQSFSRELANGKYLVNLYFAETYQRVTGPGQRVFSFAVNGIEFRNFDIWEKAGGFNRVYVESVPVEIESGRLHMTFAAQVENPCINAIEIIPQAESTSAAEIIRIDAGGAATFIDSTGRTWLADQGFVGGQVNAGNNFSPYNNAAWNSNQSPRLFLGYDADGNGLSELELPQALRFIHRRLDEDGDGVLSSSEIWSFDEFVNRESDGKQLKDALLNDDSPSVEVIGQLQQMLDSFEESKVRLAALDESQKTSTKRAEWSSYAFTVAAMLIAVLSFGHLLTASPPRRERWTRIDASPNATRSVIESLVFIVLLSLIDLMWTTFSSSEFHFLEMNPVGSLFLTQGESLVPLKVVSLISAITLLFALRKYKGAQLASWWVCLICTLVTFRWIILDSAMLGT